MANTSAATNLTPAMRNAAQISQFKEITRQAACDLRVGVPGIIQAFDSVAQTVTAQIAVREKIQVPATGPQNVAIQPLYDVPVVLPRGGGFTLTLPLKAGDECWLMFSDMTIDTWWAAGGVQNQYQFESHRHDISDVVCLPGPWSQPRKLTNYATSAAQLRADDSSAVVSVAESAVSLIAPAITASNGGAAQALVTDTFYQWYATNIQPFLVSKGYAGPGIPTGSETTVLKGQ